MARVWGIGLITWNMTEAASSNKAVRIALARHRLFLGGPRGATALCRRTFGKRNVVELLKTDSTIAPPKSSDFLKRNVSWLLDTRKETIEKENTHIFFVCKGLSIDGVGVVDGHRISGDTTGGWF